MLVSRERRGELDGLMYVIDGKAGGFSGMAGCFRDDPQRAIESASVAMANLYTYAARKRFDPMTATDFT